MTWRCGVPGARLTDEAVEGRRSMEAETPRTCPQCGAIVAESDAICSACGEPLAAAGAPPAVAFYPPDLEPAVVQPADADAGPDSLATQDLAVPRSHIAALAGLLVAVALLALSLTGGGFITSMDGPLAPTATPTLPGPPAQQFAGSPAPSLTGSTPAPHTPTIATATTGAGSGGGGPAPTGTATHTRPTPTPTPTRTATVTPSPTPTPIPTATDGGGGG